MTCNETTAQGWHIYYDQRHATAYRHGVRINVGGLTPLDTMLEMIRLWPELRLDWSELETQRKGTQ